MTAAALASYPHDPERDLGAWSRDMAGTISRKFQNAGLRLQPQAQQYPSRNSSDQNRLTQPHMHSPSPEQSGAEGESMHRPTSGRISELPDKTEVRDKLRLAFAQAVPSAKHLAVETGASVDTAEGWRSGLNIPGGYNLILLARQFPEVRAVVRQLIDCDFDQDPRAYALFIEAMRYAQGRVK